MSALMDANSILDMIEGSISSFLEDPPDSEWQAGYLAAMLEMYERASGRECRVTILRNGRAVLQEFDGRAGRWRVSGSGSS